MKQRNKHKQKRAKEKKNSEIRKKNRGKRTSKWCPKISAAMDIRRSATSWWLLEPSNSGLWLSFAWTMTRTTNMLAILCMCMLANNNGYYGWPRCQSYSTSFAMTQTVCPSWTPRRPSSTRRNERICGWRMPLFNSHSQSFPIQPDGTIKVHLNIVNNLHTDRISCARHYARSNNNNNDKNVASISFDVLILNETDGNHVLLWPLQHTNET